MHLHILNLDQYYVVPGTDTVVPIMSLGDELMKLSLNNGQKKALDPATEAMRSGRVPTMSDVKKALKVGWSRSFVHRTSFRSFAFYCSL